ncbi:hypothetical protein OENI_370004 [Oenococcus oeni]|nr:hypothetical protein OENI_370004 [Oenococcus oeni]
MISAASGFGYLRLIDGDIVELSNITRQIFYTENDVNNEYKVDAMKRSIHQLNSSVHVEAIRRYVNKKTIIKNNFFKDINLVVQAADQPSGLIDKIVVENALKAGAAVILVHNGSVGPLFEPGHQENFRKFIKFLNRDSDGFYEQLIYNRSKFNRTAFPTIAQGILGLTQELCDYILQYAVTGSVPKLENSFYSLSKRKYINFIDKKGR